MPNLHNPEDKVYAPLLDRFDLKIVTEYIKDKSARQQILHDITTRTFTHTISCRRFSVSRIRSLISRSHA